MNATEIQTFLRAGRAVFTLESVATGRHFTYRVKAGDARPPVPKPYFIGLLIAPDTWGYVGMLSALGRLRQTRASSGGPAAEALTWFLRQLERGELPPSVVFRHEGRCGRCGRALTTPASIDTGLGPDCAEALGVPHEAHEAHEAQAARFGRAASKLAALIPSYAGEPGDGDSLP